MRNEGDNGATVQVDCQTSGGEAPEAPNHAQQKVPMITWRQRRFCVDLLERASALYADVEARRWEARTMNEHDRKLLCECWVAEARALTETLLGSDDLEVCRWIFRVVKAIACTTETYIFGLRHDHRTDWASRARLLRDRLLVRARRGELRESGCTAPTVVPMNVTRLPVRRVDVVVKTKHLSGMTVVVIGGVVDRVLLDRYRDAEFKLEWVPGENVRQVQALEERVRRGHVGGVIFLSDLNRHASFHVIRSACAASGTPLVITTKGAAALERALRDLDDGREPVPSSA